MLRLRFANIIVPIVFCFNLLSQGQTKIVSGAREYNFNAYNTEDGLVGLSIQKIFQDQKRNVYVCSNAGLSVFDGKVFRNFTLKEGLPDNIVWSGIEDDNGVIWVGTQKGIAYLKHKRFISYDTSLKLPYCPVISFLKDSDKTLWLGTSWGVYHINPSNLKNPLIKIYKLHKEKDRNITRCMFKTSDGKIVAGSEGGTYILEKDTFIYTGFGHGVHNMLEITKNKFWYCAWRPDVYQTTNGKHDSSFNLNSVVLDIKRDKKGNIWFATWDKGLFKYNGKTLVNYTTKEGLPSNSYWSAFCDQEGNMWFGSWGSGLVKFTGDRFSYLSEKYGLLKHDPLSISEDKNGLIWIGFSNGASCYDPESGKVQNFDSFNNAPLKKVSCLFVDSSNTVWLVGYSLYAYKITNNKLSYLDFPGGLTGMKDSKGGTWFGSDYGGAIHFWPDGKYKRYLTYSKQIVNRINIVHEDKKGNMWFSNSDFGINYLDGDTSINLCAKDGFFDSNVYSISNDPDGCLWIEVDGKGTYKFNIDQNKKMRIVDSLTRIDGIPSAECSAPIFIGKRIYVSSNKGLCVIEQNDFKKHNGKVRIFTKEDGLVNSNVGISLVDKRGHLWLTSAKGVYCFNINDTTPNSLEPSTLINDLELFFDTANWAPFSKGYNAEGLPLDLNLPYDKNHLTFGFIGINHTAPNNVKYTYKLEGLDKNWSPITKKSEAVYSNIPPGTYTFMVKACNNDGVWNVNSTNYIFTIHPPFWRTTWFYLLCVIIIITLIYLYIRARERKLLKEKNILEDKVNERTIQLKSALTEISEKNKDITDSINYAKKIQEALLPAKEIKYEIFPNAFVLFNPRDIVSGDFYWFTSKNGKRIITAVDCTGHGVPGAFMSMIGNTFLNEIIEERGITEPASILSELRHLVIKSLKQDGLNAESKDGMDMALLTFDDKENVVEFAGANNPLWLIRNGECIEYNGDKRPIGYYRGRGLPFTNHKIEMQKGDTYYIFTDGFADQFGGPKGKKFKYKQLQEILLSIQKEPMLKQEDILLKTFSDWKGTLEQIDDVLIIGVRI